MRKNRANNGYVGQNRNYDISTGAIAAQKLELYAEDNNRYIVSGVSLDSDYLMPTDRGGSGATASITMGPGRIYSISVTGTGGNYTNGSYILGVISGGGGNTLYATPTLSGRFLSSVEPWFSIDSITILDGGSGYTSVPTVTVSAPTGNLPTATFTGNISGTTLTTTTFSSGQIYVGQLISGPGVTTGTIITGYGTGTGTAGTYIVSKSNSVSSIAMNGSGTALGVATIANGQVTSVGLTYGGMKYQRGTIPTITFSGGGSVYRTASAIGNYSYGGTYSSNPGLTFIFGGTGSGATTVVNLTRDIDTISITNGGSGYSTNPSIFLDEFTGRGVQGIATVSSGQVTGITLQNAPLRNFYETPTLTIGGWPDLPSVTAGEQKIAGAFAVFNNDSNYVAFTITGCPFTVNWGDGTTSGYTSGAQALKQYTTASYAGLTSSVFNGYKPVIITVVPTTAGNTFSAVRFNSRHPALGISVTSDNWLAIRMASSTTSVLELATNTGSSSSIAHYMLQMFDYVGTNSITNGSYLFNDLKALKRIVNFNPTAINNMTSMFASCGSLQTVPLFDTKLVTTMANCFSSCASLKTIPAFDTRSCTTFFGIFSNCTALITVPLLNTSNVTSFVNAFSTCYNLRSVPLFDTSRVTSFSSAFDTCYALSSIPKFNTINVTTFARAFTDCRSLTYVPQFDTRKVTSMDTTFSGCYSLKYVEKLDMRKVTTTNNMFANCNSLKFVPDMETPNLITIAGMFNGCASLVKAPMMDTKLVNSFATVFQNCRNLNYVPLYDMSSNTSLSFTFNGCTTLSGVPKFNTINVADMTSTFSGCYRLSSVPQFYLPRCTIFSGTFQNCLSLQYMPPIIMTPTVSVPISYSFNNTFNGCAGLKELSGITCASKVTANTTIYSSMLLSSNSIARVGLIGIDHNFALPNPNLLGSTALNELYTNLAVVGASGANAKTLTITGSLGSAASSRFIATAKGWAVSG